MGTSAEQRKSVHRDGDTFSKSAGDPRKEIRWGFLLGVAMLGCFLLWGLSVRLDAAARVPGYLVVAGQNRAIQYRDGGTIGTVAVTEGESVRAGQLLVQFSNPEVKAQERVLSDTVIQLLAQRARLRAERTGGPILAFSEMNAFGQEDAAKIADALMAQREVLKARQLSLASRLDVIVQRGFQARAREAFNQSGLRARNEQLQLIEGQLADMKKLAEKGFVSKNQIRDLQRAKAAQEGERDQFVAQIAASKSESREVSAEIQAVRSDFRKEIESELADIDVKLGEAWPKLMAAREQLKRTQLRAPVDGRISDLKVFSAGTVVSPGTKLMDIVPSQRILVVEGRLDPQDADDVRKGQRVEVRLVGMPDLANVELHGIVTQVSADRLVDERTGASYFRLEVFVPEDELASITHMGGADFELRPGQPADLIVLLRKRTALSYLFEPLTRHLRGAMTEQ